MDLFTTSAAGCALAGSDHKDHGARLAKPSAGGVSPLGHLSSTSALRLSTATVVECDCDDADVRPQWRFHAPTPPLLTPPNCSAIARSETPQPGQQVLGPRPSGASSPASSSETSYVVFSDAAVQADDGGIVAATVLQRERALQELEGDIDAARAERDALLREIALLREQRAALGGA